MFKLIMTIIIFNINNYFMIGEGMPKWKPCE